MGKFPGKLKLTVEDLIQDLGPHLIHERITRKFVNQLVWDKEMASQPTVRPPAGISDDSLELESQNTAPTNSDPLEGIAVRNHPLDEIRIALGLGWKGLADMLDSPMTAFVSDLDRALKPGGPRLTAARLQDCCRFFDSSAKRKVPGMSPKPYGPKRGNTKDSLAALGQYHAQIIRELGVMPDSLYRCGGIPVAVGGHSYRLLWFFAWVHAQEMAKRPVLELAKLIGFEEASGGNSQPAGTKSNKPRQHTDSVKRAGESNERQQAAMRKIIYPPFPLARLAVITCLARRLCDLFERKRLYKYCFAFKMPLRLRTFNIANKITGSSIYDRRIDIAKKLFAKLEAQVVFTQKEVDSLERDGSFGDIGDFLGEDLQRLLPPRSR